MLWFTALVLLSVLGKCTINFGRDVAQTNLPFVVLIPNVLQQNPNKVVLQPAGKPRIISLGPFSELQVSCPGNNPVQPNVLVKCSNNQMTLDEDSINKLHCAQPISITFLLEDSTTFPCEGGVAKTLELRPYDNLTPLVTLARVCIKEDRNTKGNIFTLHTIRQEYLSEEENKQKNMVQIKGNSNEPIVKHLMVPEEDLITFPTAEIDKKNLNELTIPMYASISKNNMFNVEKAIRKISLKHGNINVLTLPITIKGAPRKKVLLDNEETEVIIPLIVAKIVEIVQKEDCVAILVVNSLVAVKGAENICHSKCDTYKYELNFHDDVHSGLVLCCDYKDISKFLPAGIINKPGFLPCS